MNIQWNKVTWYSKLAAVVLGLVIFCVGIYIGTEIEELKQQNFCCLPPMTKIKQCPDEWIYDKMPTVGGNVQLPKTYFIFSGERKEIDNYDIDWITRNCKVTPTEVQ